MSLKTKRIASDISKELCNIILEESRNDVLKSITITGCEVTTDLSFCKVYYTYYGEYNDTDVKMELERCTPFLKKNLAKRVQIRHIPELIFIEDKSIEYGTKIERLIKEIHNND